jgi:hypothetical protein
MEILLAFEVMFVWDEDFGLHRVKNLRYHVNRNIKLSFIVLMKSGVVKKLQHSRFYLY